MQPAPLPVEIRMLERHPLSSQAFVPLSAARFLLVVAAPGESVLPGGIRAFVSDGRQGVNYRRGVWHHPVLALDAETDFLVIDRGGEGTNCDEVSPAAPVAVAWDRGG